MAWTLVYNLKPHRFCSLRKGRSGWVGANIGAEGRRQDQRCGAFASLGGAPPPPDFFRSRTRCFLLVPQSISHLTKFGTFFLPTRAGPRHPMTSVRIGALLVSGETPLPHGQADRAAARDERRFRLSCDSCFILRKLSSFFFPITASPLFTPLRPPTCPPRSLLALSRFKTRSPSPSAEDSAHGMRSPPCRCAWSRSSASHALVGSASSRSRPCS